jgi:hypothetical protein
LDNLSHPSIEIRDDRKELQRPDMRGFISYKGKKRQKQKELLDRSFVFLLLPP